MTVYRCCRSVRWVAQGLALVANWLRRSSDYFAPTSNDADGTITLVGPSAPAHRRTRVAGKETT